MDNTSPAPASRDPAFRHFMAATLTPVAGVDDERTPTTDEIIEATLPIMVALRANPNRLFVFGTEIRAALNSPYLVKRTAAMMVLVQAGQAILDASWRSPRRGDDEDDEE